MKILSKALGILVMLLVVLASASALAQDEPQISEKQQSLNDRAVRLIIEEDHAGAVALLEESIALGPINVTYLNLGRAYQALGKCDKARAALQNALDAPKVSDPSPEFVEKRVQSALAELDEQCEDEEAAATAEQTQQAEPQEAEQTQSAQPAEPVAPPPEPSHTLEWAAIGTGSAMLVASGVFYFLAESKRAEITDTPAGEVSPLTRAEATEIADSAATYRTTSLGLAVGGAAIAGVGAVLLLTDSPDEGASVSFGPDSVSLDWRVSF